MSHDTDFHNRPCAIKGLVSYRYKGTYGWIMIGARDHDDAIREAKRSIDKSKYASISFSNLEVWDEQNNAYVPVKQEQHV